MTETTATQETETAETTKIGVSIGDALAEYRRIVDAARDERDRALEENSKPLRDFETAASRLFGRDVSYHMTVIARLHVGAKIGATAKEIRDAYDKTVDAAREKRKEAYRSDPFTKFVDTCIRRQYGDSDTDTLLQALPATIDELKQLAHEQGWCSEFETALRWATDKGVLDVGFDAITYSVQWDDVPYELNAKTGEIWEVNVTLPRFVRTKSASGVSYTFWDVKDWATETVFRKVAAEEDAPAEG